MGAAGAIGALAEAAGAGTDATGEADAGAWTDEVDEAEEAGPGAAGGGAAQATSHPTSEPEIATRRTRESMRPVYRGPGRVVSSRMMSVLEARTEVDSRSSRVTGAAPRGRFPLDWYYGEASHLLNMTFNIASRRMFLFAAGAALFSSRAEAQPPPAAAEASEPAPPASQPQGPIEVRVDAEKADALKRSSGSGTTISARDIKRAQPSSSGEMLRRVNGLVVRQEDASGLRLNLGVRGLSPTRSRLVLVLEDGIPITVSPYGEPELYFSTPIERISSIEVIKGSDALIYGPQTLGGVVNFKTWAAPSQRGWTLEGEVGQRAYNKVVARYGDSFNDVRYVLQVARKQGDGFRNMGFETVDLMGKVVIPTSAHGEATLKLATYDELSKTTYLGLTQRQYEANPRAPTVAPSDRFALRRYDASLVHEHRFSADTTLRTRVFGYSTRIGFRQQDVDPTSQSDSGTILLLPSAALRDREYNVVGVEPSVEHRFRTSYVVHTLTVGTRLMLDSARRKLSRTDFDTRNGTPPLDSAESGALQTDNLTSIVGFAAYAQDRIAFRDDLVVTPSVRLEHSRSKRTVYRAIITTPNPADPSRPYTNPRNVDDTGSSEVTGVMPGIGMVAGSPKLNVFGSVHSGYSPPRISLAITPQGADAGLDAERSVNWELGTHVRPARWAHAELTGFLVNFSNQLISNNVLSGSFGEFKNGGATRQYGAELSAIVQLGKGLELPLGIDVSARYTYAHATFVGGLNDGRFVPYAPENTASITTDIDHSSGFGGQVSWSFIDKQYADEFNTVTPDISGRTGLIPSYQTIDAAARFTYQPWGLTSAVTVKNALDQVYISSRLPNGIFTAGFRQINVGVRWEH